MSDARIRAVPSSRSRSGTRSAIRAAAASLARLAAGSASAEPPAPGEGPLDGRVFVGRIGPAEDPDYDEELHFNEGLFWSKNCVPCGYPPAPYRSRRVGDEIRFRGELRNAAGTRFVYEGVVAGERAEAAARWTKARWYWTLERDLAFRGGEAADRVPTTSREAVAAAETALLGELPEWRP